MATPAQIAANQLNALKSTGPKSPEGKAQSRKNSLKHGLAGHGTVHLDADEPHIHAAVADFQQAIRPLNHLERRLTLIAADAAARLERSAYAEAAELADQARRLPVSIPIARRQAADRAIEHFQKDPHNALFDLQQSTAGLDWLILQWQTLADALQPDTGYWTGPHYHAAVTLLDLNQFDLVPSNAKNELASSVVASQPKFARDRDLEWMLCVAQGQKADPADGPDALEPTLPDPARARDTLRRLVADRLDDLFGLRDQLAEIEAASDAEAHLRLNNPATPSAQLRQRYESALFRRLNSSLIRLERLRAGKLTPADQAELEALDREAEAESQPNSESVSPLRPESPDPTSEHHTPPAELREPTAQSPNPQAECPARNEPNSPAPTGREITPSPEFPTPLAPCPAG